jgi:membrane protease YdiL (CAAX protease family)
VGFTSTSLLVGLIWAAWHYPINIAVSPLYRPNVPLWYSNACFTLAVIGISFMHTWLRIRSQSLWPSALFHAAGNAFQGVLQAATLETSVTSYLTTEYGAGFAAVGCVFALLFWRKRGEIEPATGCHLP